VVWCSGRGRGGSWLVWCASYCLERLRVVGLCGMPWGARGAGVPFWGAWGRERVLLGRGFGGVGGNYVWGGEG